MLSQTSRLSGIGAAFFGVAALFADLATKAWAFGISSPELDWRFQGILTWTHHRNMGITANIPVPLPLILAFTLFVLGYAVKELRQAILREDWIKALLLGLLIGGACGNLFDRVYYGHVRDWILLFGRSAMNVADFCILIGLIGLLRSTNTQKTPA